MIIKRTLLMGICACIALALIGKQVVHAEEAAAPVKKPEVKAEAVIKTEAKPADTKPAEPEPTEKPKPEAPKAAEPISPHRQFRLGPSVLLGIPHPINGALDVRFHRLFSFGLAGGKISKGLTIGGNPLKISITNYEAKLRIHPFSGSFFLGVAAGQQILAAQTSRSVSGSTTVTVEGVPIPVSYKIDADIGVKVKGSYVTPQLGWMWIWQSGFMMGLELGGQITPKAKTSVSVDVKSINPAEAAPYIELVKEQSAYKDAVKKVVDLGDKIGKMPLPYLTLLRIGWMF